MRLHTLRTSLVERVKGQCSGPREQGTYNQLGTRVVSSGRVGTYAGPPKKYVRHGAIEDAVRLMRILSLVYAVASTMFISGVTGLVKCVGAWRAAARALLSSLTPAMVYAVASMMFISGVISLWMFPNGDRSWRSGSQVPFMQAPGAGQISANSWSQGASCLLDGRRAALPHRPDAKMASLPQDEEGWEEFSDPRPVEARCEHMCRTGHMVYRKFSDPDPGGGGSSNPAQATQQQLSLIHI